MCGAVRDRCLLRRGLGAGALGGPELLNRNGCLYLTRPSLAQYTASREELLWRAESLFSWIGQNNLNVRIGGTYELSDAEQAHRDLEGRKTTGKLLLIP